MDPTHGPGYSLQSSDKHKFLLNKLAHKSGQLGGEMSSNIGIGVSSNEEKAKDGSLGDIIWSETPGYQNHFNGMNGIVRVETSP